MGLCGAVCRDGLVRSGAPWQKQSMTDPKPPAPRAAGAFIALGLILGALIGVFVRQPSIGVLAGFALGTLIALFQWRRDSRR